MNRHIKNGGKSIEPVGKEEAEKLFDALLDRLARSRAGQRRVLYRILCRLFGRHPKKEAWIYDPEGGIYAHLVPPAKRFQLQMLEDPELAAELERRQAPGRPSVPFKEVMQRLRSLEDSQAHGDSLRHRDRAKGRRRADRTVAERKSPKAR